MCIDVLSYWAWHCIITSFIDHVIQIYVGQTLKDMESNGFRRISSHCIAVSINCCWNYKLFSHTLTILGSCLKRITR